MFESEFDVRFYETDALQHVSNTVIVGWFEAARAPIFRLFSPTMNLQDWPLILAKYEVDFVAQIYFGQPVTIRTYTQHIGNSSFSVYQEVWQADACCAKGITTMVHYDYKNGRSAPIPDDIKLTLAEHTRPVD